MLKNEMLSGRCFSMLLHKSDYFKKTLLEQSIGKVYQKIIVLWMNVTH